MSYAPLSRSPHSTRLDAAIDVHDATLIPTYPRVTAGKLLSYQGGLSRPIALHQKVLANFAQGRAQGTRWTGPYNGVPLTTTHAMLRSALRRAKRHMNGFFTTLTVLSHRYVTEICSLTDATHHASCHSVTQTRAEALKMWHFLALAVGRVSGPRTPVKDLHSHRLRP